MAKIFITGASGFVGGAATKALIAAGHQVVAMARSAQSQAKVEQLGAITAPCDLDSVSAEDLQDCEMVIHAAAKVEQWGKAEDFQRINVAGTQRLLDAAKSAGVQRFIHISTEASLFYGQDIRDADESLPYAFKSPYLYARSKAAAEKLVLDYNAPDFMTIALRPRLIWGEGDQTVLAAAEQAISAGQFMWFSGGKMATSTCHIDNLIHAISLSLSKGQGGQAYFITDGETITMREFMTRYLQTQDLTVPDTSIPAPVARGAAFMLEGIWKIAGLTSQPPLTRHVAGLMSSDCTLRIDKARKDLGYQPQVTIQAGLAQMPKIL